jgi:hypothetical protein
MVPTNKSSGRFACCRGFTGAEKFLLTKFFVFAIIDARKKFPVQTAFPKGE